MKNVVKKSKFVILPALATLVLTGVASVTGTVAWFTASRDVSVSGSFISTKTDSNLSVTLANGTGTTASNDTISVQGKMTHGSYDAQAGASGTLYVASLDDDKHVTAYLDKHSLNNNTTTTEAPESKTTYHWAAKYNTEASKCIWYGVSWTMKFTYAAFADGETNYLLFNPSDSTISGIKASADESGTSTTGDTYKGFRIALMTANKYLVLGGDSQVKHVTGTSKESTGEYASANYEDLNASNKQGKLDDNAHDVVSGKYSFGTIDGTTGVTITCVAWFEGEDVDSIVDKIGDNDVVMSNVTASLNFYTRSINA